MLRGVNQDRGGYRGVGRRTAAVARGEAPEPILQYRIVGLRADRVARQSEDGRIGTSWFGLASIDQVRSWFSCCIFQRSCDHECQALAQHEA